MPNPHTLLIPLLLFIPSCAPEEVGVATAPAESPRSFVAAIDGGLAVLDAVDGRVLARAEGGLLDDVVVDRARHRIVTFEIDPEEEGGELVGRSFELGWPVTLGRSAGVIRLAATAPHVVVFEDADGPRWRLLDGRRSLFAPPPRSTWTAGDSLFGLTFEPEGAWAVRRFRLDEPASIELASAPVASRMVSLGDRVVALDVVKGSLSIDGEDTAIVAGAVVDACALSRERFAVLTASPTRVVVGEGGVVRSLTIDGAPRFDARYLSPSLVAVSEARVLVATTERVLAVDVRGANLVVDPRFAPHGARAPIAGPL